MMGMPTISGASSQACRNVPKSPVFITSARTQSLRLQKEVNDCFLQCVRGFHEASHKLKCLVCHVRNCSFLQTTCTITAADKPLLLRFTRREFRIGLIDGLHVVTCLFHSVAWTLSSTETH